MTQMIVGWGSSSMALVGPALEALLAEHEVRFVSQGSGGETSHHTAARVGSLPVPIRVAGGQLPAAGTVRLEPTPLDLVAGFLEPFAGQVAARAGVVHGTEDGMWLTRSRPGTPLPVAGEPFIPATGTALRGHDALLWMGKNDLNRGAGAAEVIARITATADWLREAGARTAVVGQFTNNGAAPAERTEVLDVNAACAERFGSAYIDVQDFLTSPDLPDHVGIAATAEDRAERTAGAKPPSLSNDPGHLNQLGNQVVAARIVGALVTLGWLDSS